MKISAVATPLMIVSSTIEKVSSAKPDDTGANPFGFGKTTVMEDCNTVEPDWINLSGKGAIPILLLGRPADFGFPF
jgi:hypothetical protein